MSDPLSLLPLAVAAGNGTIDGRETQQWISAGFTLLTRSVRLVRTLSQGRSGILLPPCGAFFSALAASDGRGAVLINPLASTSEIVRQLDDAGVTAVFTNAALATKLPSDVPRILLDDAPRSCLVDADGVVQTVDLGNHFGLSLEGSRTAQGRDEEALIVYTSAMSGTPLGARLTHRSALFNAHASASAMGDSDSDRALVALPFAHLFGLIVATCSPLLRGASVNTMPRFHPVRALEAIERDAITRFMGVPSMFYALLNVIARRPGGRFLSHNLRVCFSGGAVVPEALQDQWYDATGVELLQGYGLTEAGPAALLTRADGVNRRGAMGAPLEGTSVTIRDVATDAALDLEQEGELCVRGPHVFSGYVNDNAYGLQVRDGWLHTGDFAVQHADGTFSFRGLLKPMFTRNGFNIYPAEIEQTLLRMPGVQSVRVSAIDDVVKEHDIAVRVTGAVSEQEVKQWAQRELATYKVPSYFEVVPA